MVLNRVLAQSLPHPEAGRDRVELDHQTKTNTNKENENEEIHHRIGRCYALRVTARRRFEREYCRLTFVSSFPNLSFPLIFTSCVK